ncbi:alpha/beta hydrolase [Kribbella sancticallisti]|uniref:Alpha/beta hydrolase n=1 Tax=Kribbella sancticallisti TaxID=460087 RepID=A0ABN2DWP9_9ACTN
MNEQNPVVVLVHGAFAESGGWNAVIERLLRRSAEVVAVANPLRSLPGDAAYVRDVIAGIGKPVVLVGHSYGGSVITEAAAHHDTVKGLVYVCAFAPDHGESAFELASKRPGSTLGEALVTYPLGIRGNELSIGRDAFHRQFAADVPAAQAALMCATQRPVAQLALMTGLPTHTPAWKTLPSWFAFGDEDLNIPIAVHRYMARRANAVCTREVAGASHALSISAPDAVTAAIIEALDA